MERKAEIREITLLQSFGIFLVVLGHSYIEINKHPQDPILSAFYWFHHFIYSFHMPLFMLLSGFLFFHSNTGESSKGASNFISSRFKRILAPYIIISSLTFPIKVLLNKFAARPLDLNIASYIKTIIYPTSNTIFFYWFLPTLFAVSLIAYLLFALIRNKNLQQYSLVIFLAFLLLNLFNPFKSQLLNIKGIANYLIYFWSGCVYYIYKDKLSSILNKPFVLLFIFLLLLSINIFTTPDANSFTKLLAAFSGICVSIGLANIFINKGLVLFRYINGFSYQIYLLSWFPQIFFKIVLSDILHVGFYPSFIFMLAGGIIFPVAVAKFMSKRPTGLNFIVGLRSKA